MSTVEKRLLEVQNRPIRVEFDPDDERIAYVVEGESGLPSHKFRSACFLVREQLHRRPLMAADRSSGSWAMALAFATSIAGGTSVFVSVGPPPKLVEDYVHSHGGRFEIVDDNSQRISTLHRLTQSGYWTPDQHNNPLLIDAFHVTLGAQIAAVLRDRELNPQFVVAPVGTGGLLAGVARAIRSEFASRRLTAIGVDLSSSVNHLGPRSWKPSQLKVRGVGSDDEVCGTFRYARRHINEMIATDVFQAGGQVDRLSRMLPYGCGMSGGLAAFVASSLVASRCDSERPGQVLVILPDCGLLYNDQMYALSKLFGGRT